MIDDENHLSRINMIVQKIRTRTIFGISIIVCTLMGVAILPLSGVTSQSTGSPQNSGLVDIAMTNDGVWNPSNDWVRYRGAEYPNDVDFYQWWYFTVKDCTSDTYWAYAYYINDAISNNQTAGVYMIFTMVSPQGNFWMYYKFPLSSAVYEGNNFQMNIDNGNYRLIPVSNGVYRTTGNMADASDVWMYDQTNGMTGINENTVITWDFTLTRIIGCMVENDIDTQGDYEKNIMWNTFAYDCSVIGSVSIGNQVWSVNADSTRYRAYGDQNWGCRFLEGSPAIDYRWGWFSATKKGSNPANDVSIIAGYGQDTMSTIDGVTFDDFKSVGQFVSTYNTLNHNVTVKSVHGFPLGIETVLVEKCNWGSSADDKISIDVSSSNWFTYTDIFGNAQIPSKQVMTINTEYMKIILDYTVNAADINRLFCPHKDGLWSNFEALGAQCSVSIYSKSYPWWDLCHVSSPTLTLADSFVDTNAGLEYGYNIEGIAIP